MSKNYFRSQLRKLGKSREKRNKSTTCVSPESCTPSASPVHAQIPKNDSSYSLSSTASGGNFTSIPRVEEPLERKEVISITGDVQKFVAAISELKKAMEEADEENEEVDNVSQESEEGETGHQSETEASIMVHLKDLIQVVHSCLDQYQGMQSTEIKNAATELMSSFKTCEHVSASRCPSCNSAVDVLVDAFTTSVQVFLGGEGNEPLLPPPHRRFHGHSNLLKGFSKSHDNLGPRYSSYMDLTQQVNEPIVDEIDKALANTENNVDVAARYIKMRTKYHREITAYLSKRGHIEMRYHQEMLKLARKTHTAVTELRQQEECLPLVDLFLESVDQDMRFSSNSNTIFNIQVGGKVVEPLEQKTAENERHKKELTQTWQKELKKLTDAKTAMKSAKAKYSFMGQDLARVKTLLTAEPYGKQADKRKKEVAELEMRWQEAEAAYKNAVAVCNSCQYQVHKSAQQSILCAYRRLVLDFDMSLKSKLETYFQLQHNFFSPIPEVMASYLSAVQDCEVGQHFMQYIRRHPTMSREPEDYLFEEFNPEEEDTDESTSSGLTELSRTRSSSSSETVHRVPLISDALRRALSPQLLPAWGSSAESRARVSPRVGKLEGDRTRPNSMAFLLDPNTEFVKHSGPRRNSEQPVSLAQDVHMSPEKGDEVQMSKNALTHTFKNLRAPSRCRECDNFVYFNGYECETCGLACHKKCLAPLSIRCGNKRLDRKLTTFGVDFLKHLEMSKSNIPIIVTKCIKEIDERGLDTHGLYRISTTKTKLEHLCQLFESGVDRVDLSDRQPHLVASCLKLYFRQLPEPIFTFSLYEDMVSFAREASQMLPCNFSTGCNERRESALIQLERLKELLSCLDHHRYLTLARLFYHLHRVSSSANVKKNCMPASNLGIVFGPTLLRRRDNVASLTLLADMTAQAKAIEILISHAHEVFTVSEEELQILEGIDPDEGHVTEERLVDGLAEIVEPLTKTVEVDIDDSSTRTPYRTPFGTPPQRRRENISELQDVLDALQSAFPRRKSLPAFSVVPLADMDGHHHIQSLPSTVVSHDDAINTLRQQLRQSPHMPPGLSKTLTPVDEKTEKVHRFSEDEEDDAYSRVGRMGFSSVLSNPGSIGMLGDLESGIGSMHNFDMESVFSAGDPPRRILVSSSSAENVMEDQPIVTKSQEDYRRSSDVFKDAVPGILGQNKETNSSQESIGHYYDPMSKHTKASLEQEGSPTSLHLFSSSDEATPDRMSAEQMQRSPGREEQRGSEDEIASMRSWDPMSPSFPEHLHHTTQQLTEYSTQNIDSAVAPGMSNTQLASAEKPGDLSLTSLLHLKQHHLYNSPTVSGSRCEIETKAEDHSELELNLPNESGSLTSRSFKTLYSSPVRHRRQDKYATSDEHFSPTCSPVGIEQETEEVVTTFDYESDESEHSTLMQQPNFSPSIVSYKGGSTVQGSMDTNPHTSRNSTSPFHTTSVSPWHDKRRKIRINPLRVLKVAQTSPVLPIPPDADRTRMISPEDITAEKSGDKLKRSRSCGLFDGTKYNPASPEPLHTIAEATDVKFGQMDLDLSTITKQEYEKSLKY